VFIPNYYKLTIHSLICRESTSFAHDFTQTLLRTGVLVEQGNPELINSMHMFIIGAGLAQAV